MWSSACHNVSTETGQSVNIRTGAHIKSPVLGSPLGEAWCKLVAQSGYRR
jgi:hypothetical protein